MKFDLLDGNQKPLMMMTATVQAIQNFLSYVVKILSFAPECIFQDQIH